MLRLDPGEGRIRTARAFRVWEGGGEYNVARGLRRCFGLRTAVVTALADNEVGRLVEDCILQGGVDTRHVLLAPVRRHRPRGAQRAQLHRARLRRARRRRRLRPRPHRGGRSCGRATSTGTHLFGVEGVRWFHTGGIFAALSETTPDVVAEAIDAARAARHDRVVRPQLPAEPVEGDRRRRGARARSTASSPRTST